MQDIGTIAAVGSFLLALLIALWGVPRYIKSRDIILENEESEHNWQGARGEFKVRFRIENNQKREIPILGVHLFRDNDEMPNTPYTLEIAPTIRIPSGERMEMFYRFKEPEGRSLGLQRRIQVKLVVEWNGSSTSKEIVSKLEGSV